MASFGIPDSTRSSIWLINRRDWWGDFCWDHEQRKITARVYIICTASIPTFSIQVSSIKYLAKPLSTFHQINAYEEDGLLILDMCASDDGQAISNYNIQNLRKSGEALDEVRRVEKKVASGFTAEVGLTPKIVHVYPQVYNTLCRVFPRRFVLPLVVDHNTPYNQNLNQRLDSTATCVRISKNKVKQPT